MKTGRENLFLVEFCLPKGAAKSLNLASVGVESEAGGSASLLSSAAAVAASSRPKSLLNRLPHFTDGRSGLFGSEVRLLSTGPLRAGTELIDGECGGIDRHMSTVRGGE